MPDPKKPDRRLPTPESPKEPAASRETSRPADSVPLVSAQFANLPATFGRYQVERLLGRGAMGAVYLARDTQLDRFVALKIPKVTAAGSKKLLLRLETEAKAAAQLDHPSLCKVHDAGEINGQCFIAMQYIEGETLKAQLDVQSKTVAEAVSLILQLAEGLSEAHALGIIHRDLKPENIMINRRGMPVIMDFGLAKFSTISSNAKATQAGTILGSPAYMSPEQASGNVREIDQRSDLYALGTVLFELLTGQLPFNGSAMQILGQKSILEAASPLSLKPDLSPRLAAICHKMITRKSADRYQTLAEVIADLRGVDLSFPPPVIDTLSAEASPFSSLAVSDQPVERTARTAKRQQAPPAQGARDSSRSLKARFQQLAAWWKDQSPLMRRTSLGGAAFLVLCGVIIITIKSKDGTQFKIEVPDTSTVAISTDSRRRTNETPGRAKQVPGLALADSPKVAGEQKELSPGMKFRWCPAGSFTMGSPTSEQGRGPDEDQAAVTFSSGFWLGETEVTQGQWMTIMGTAPWIMQSRAKEGSGFAANYVSHDDATAFCVRLSEREQELGRLPVGWKYALPTEAQWEYGCRAGTQTQYSFGDDEGRFGDYAWYDKNAWNVEEKYPHEVGRKRANTWGLRDMHGNVKEWCADWYSAKLSGGRDPVGDSAGSDRVERGGSWVHAAAACRSAYRFRYSPNYRDCDLGFRVALVNQAQTVAENASSTKTEAVPISANTRDISGTGPITEKQMALASQSSDLGTFSGKVAGEGKELVSGMKFRWCPAGSFTMGSPKSEPGHAAAEDQVAVTISNGFWLGETEVTQGQWKLLMETEPWKGQPRVKEGSEFAASYLSYDDATSFCERLTERGRKSGHLPVEWKCALPTEAQWEYGCRAGTQTQFTFGDDESRTADYAWYEGNAARINETYAHEVGKKNANAWGLRDVHGNVWEWCADWYGEKLSGGRDPLGESAGSSRVLRGGTWGHQAQGCRSAYRYSLPPGSRMILQGLRVAFVRDVAALSVSKVPGNQSVATGTITDLKAISDPHRRFAHWVIWSGGALATKTGQWCNELAMLPATPFTVAGADLVDLQMIPEPIDAVAEQLNLTWVVSKKNSPEAAITLANKNSRSLTGIKFDGPVTDAMLAQLRGSDTLETFDFYGSNGFSEEGLKSLRLFPNLTRIGFNVGPLNDAGMAHLAGLQKIDDLVLWGTAVTDAGLVHLKGMPLLQSLQLGTSYGIAGPGIQHLVGLPKLKYLSVHQTSFGDVGMEYIGKLPAIETLHLSFIKITDAQLHRLDTLTKLKILHLTGTQVTDAGLAKLEVLGRVTELGLSETGLTDAGLANLQRHKNLKRLYVQKTKVTEAAVIAFRKALPNCLIESDFSKKETSGDAIGAKSPSRLATDPTKKGLLAEFFAGPDFDRKTKERIELGIDTTLYNGWVDDLVPPGKFSVRWTGFIKAPSTGLYELVTESDDGVRVWIDGKLVIDDWVAHPPQAKVGEFRFDDRPHSIKIEFWESHQGGYFLQLKWRKGNGTLGLIPAEAFFQPPDRGR